jgi:hypothetical protein
MSFIVYSDCAGWRIRFCITIYILANNWQKIVSVIIGSISLSYMILCSELSNFQVIDQVFGYGQAGENWWGYKRKFAWIRFLTLKVVNYAPILDISHETIRSILQSKFMHIDTQTLPPWPTLPQLNIAETVTVWLFGNSPCSTLSLGAGIWKRNIILSYQWFGCKLGNDRAWRERTNSFMISDVWPIICISRIWSFLVLVFPLGLVNWTKTKGD